MIDLEKDTYVIISAEQPYFVGKLTGHDILTLVALGVAKDVVQVTGKYNAEDEIERAVIASFDDIDDAKEWGDVTALLFGQESYVISHEGHNALVFPRNPNQNVTGQGVTWFEEAPELYYSTLPDGRHFSLNLDF